VLHNECTVRALAWTEHDTQLLAAGASLTLFKVTVSKEKVSTSQVWINYDDNSNNDNKHLKEEYKSGVMTENERIEVLLVKIVINSSPTFLNCCSS